MGGFEHLQHLFLRPGSDLSKQVCVYVNLRMRTYCVCVCVCVCVHARKHVIGNLDVIGNLYWELLILFYTPPSIGISRSLEIPNIGVFHEKKNINYIPSTTTPPPCQTPSRWITLDPSPFPCAKHKPGGFLIKNF